MSQPNTPTVKKLPPSDLKSAEYIRHVHHVVTQPEVTIDDVLDPAYWAHIAERLRPMSKIEVVFADYTRYLELIVLSSGRLWAKVAILNDVDLVQDLEDSDQLREASDLEDADYFVKYHPTQKYTVYRKSDKQAISKSHASKKEAEAWIDQHIKALAR